MKRSIVALAAAAISTLAACGSKAQPIGGQIYGPTDVVPFRGVAGGPTEVRDYLAVAAGRGNELRLVDLSNDKPVLGPTVVFPLSIPSATHPLRLAAASLGDGGADALVAVSAGSASLELVVTWSSQNKIADVYDLGVEAPTLGTAPEVLALASAPIPGATGQARIIAALTGGKLAIVTAARQPDGSVALLRPAEVRDLGFDALDLAVYESHVAGSAGLWLFAASTDDLSPPSGVFGVAQLEISGAPSSWNPIALDARAPTRLVAAVDLIERSTEDMAVSDFSGPEVLRVFAVLDPSGCGLEYRMNCGIATLDPVTRALAPDPSGEMDHRAPMRFPGIALGLAITQQPAQLTNSVCNSAYTSVTPDVPPPYPTARLLLAPGSGQRCTSAAAALTASDGRVYVFDLGRWSAPNDVSMLRGNTRTRAVSVTQARDTADPGVSDVAPQLAFWDGDGADAQLSLTADLSKWFVVTPGYTPTETFHIGWKMPLPELTAREALVGRLPTGEVYLAAQADLDRQDASGNPVWAVGVRLADPVNGIRPGDILQLVTTSDATCAVGASGVLPETTIGAVLEPDAARFPGGAVTLTPLTDAGGQPVSACWDQAIAASPNGLARVTFTIRSSGHMVYGESFGYLGRPEKDVRFTLAWRNEADPALTPEERAVARKLRRLYYPGAEKCDASTPCIDFPGLEPLAPGPMLSFRLGWLTTGGRTGPEPLRNEQLITVTQSGLSQMFRKPTNSGALPLGIWPVDKSAILGPTNTVRFYTAYQDDQVFVFSPGEFTGSAYSIR